MAQTEPDDGDTPEAPAGDAVGDAACCVPQAVSMVSAATASAAVVRLTDPPDVTDVVLGRAPDPRGSAGDAQDQVVAVSALYFCQWDQDTFHTVIPLPPSIVRSLPV